MTDKIKKIIIVTLALVLIFVVYAIFIKKDPLEVPLVSPSGTSPEAQVLGSQISQALLRIEQITLDQDIFSDPIYQSLVDRSEPISEEPIGRTNPFAPIGSISINSNTRTSTSTAPAGN